jgi:hypothetical protein
MPGIAGEFAVNTLRKASRMASEISEPGISLKMTGRDGEKEMHLVFPSTELREMWLDQLAAIMPKEQPPVFAQPQYSTTMVTPPVQSSGQAKFCTVCGTRNHPDDRFCAMCGKPLDGSRASEPVPDIYGSAGDDEETPRRRVERRRKPAKRRKSGDRKAPKRKTPREYNGSSFGFLLHPSDAYSYYRQESPGGAAGTFLLSGIVWAVVSVLLLAYAVPRILNITEAEFPILGGLSGSMMDIGILIVMLLLLWVIFLVVQAVITAVFSKVLGGDVSIGEVLAVVMRGTLPYAAIGWIPGFGVIIAAVWSTILVSKGLESSLEMRGGCAIGAAFIGFVIVAAVLVVVGLI